MTRITKTLAALVAVGLVAAAVAFWPRGGQVSVSADFTRAVGLYPGSDVRILGVRVGQVDAVEPAGDHVHVTFSYDDRYRVPATAKAAIVAPSLVSDRYVQLLPVYESGPTLAAGARIPLGRTAVPVELDRVSQSLDDLMVALGPDGANKDGALSDLLRTSAANLDGNGDRLGSTVHDLSTALATLSGSKEDLFGTVRNLQSFTSMLAANNAQVRRLNSDLATVAVQLRGEREDLKATLAHVGTAVDEVSSFVHDNRALLHRDLSRAVAVTSTLVKNRQALAETLENAPVALSNLQNAYHPQTGTLDTRNNAKGLDDPLLLVCSILTGPTRTGNTRLCDALRAALLPKVAAMPAGPGLPTPPTLPTLPSGTGLPAPQGSPLSGGPVALRGADPTLGGLLGGGR
ncbi:MCE family protein [Intrasporangium mesophilum]